MEKYTESDIIELYCLGLLPQSEAAALTLAAAQDTLLQQQIKEMEEALTSYSHVNRAATLKESILNTLSLLPPVTKIDIANPPLINRNSDIADWNEAIAHIEPENDHGSIKTSFITTTPELQLCVAWLFNRLDEDEHHEDEFEESFLILEGSCECNIGGKIFRLKAGDYLDIPFNTHHTITSTSPQGGYVKAIIQRKKTAA
jgi:mannose-6-phosphate isomerase-like protein (cupin superfamily)